MKTVTEDKVGSVRRRVLDAKSLRDEANDQEREAGQQARLSFKLAFPEEVRGKFEYLFSRIEKAEKAKTKGKS